MVRRKCLDCPAFIGQGSRCAACSARYRSAYSRHQWAAAVKARDGYRCVICGSGDRVQADHIVGLAQGGTDTLGNGRTLCHRHHVEKHGGVAARNRSDIPG